MDVREKLVELLREAPYNIFGNKLGNYYFDSCLELIADHLITNGVTVQEWISTDKRMPTQEDASTEYVFTAYKNENCYDVNISLWDTVIAYPDLYDYWMPLSLPQPPKGE